MFGTSSRSGMRSLWCLQYCVAMLGAITNKYRSDASNTPSSNSEVYISEYIFHFERIIWKTQSLSLFTIRTVLLSALNIHWLCHTNIDTHILAANISSPLSPIWSRCCSCPTKRQTIIGKPFYSHKLIRFRLGLTGLSDDQQCDTMLHILPNALAPSRQYPYHLTHYLYIIIIHSSNLLTTPRVHCVRMHMAEWPSRFTQLHFTIYTKFTMYINIEL